MTELEVGDLLNTWVGIRMAEVDQTVAEAKAKVAAIPDYHTLMLLVGEMTVRLHWLEVQVDQLKKAGR